MKQAIMEVIMRADNNLTQEQIHWAIKNIPNDETSAATSPSEKLSWVLTFDHTKDDILSACGITDEICKQLFEEIKQINNAREGGCKSNLIEDVVKCGSPMLLNYLIVRGVISVIEGSEKTHKSDAVSDSLELLMKFLKDKREGK